MDWTRNASPTDGTKDSMTGDTQREHTASGGKAAGTQHAREDSREGEERDTEHRSHLKDHVVAPDSDDVVRDAKGQVHASGMSGLATPYETTSNVSDAVDTADAADGRARLDAGQANR